MGHNSVVLGYPKSIRIPWIEWFSMGPPSSGASHKEYLLVVSLINIISQL